MNCVAIIGASGHGKVVADALLQLSANITIVFFDDAFPSITLNAHWAVAGNTSDFIKQSQAFDGVVVAIGNNHIRLAKQIEIEISGAKILSVIHPKAIVSPYAAIGKGVVVLAGAVVNAFSTIGNGCIINSNAVVEHDVKLCDAVHICPGANVAGGVVIEQESWIGIGSCVKQLVHIGKNVTVGAGAVVIKDIPDNETVVGSPAKLIRQ